MWGFEYGRASSGALLIFTLLIWVLYFLIYYSSPRNKVNRWCGIGGVLLSIGVLKEYLYYSGIFAGMEVELFGVVNRYTYSLNSILTAVLYYTAMPCVMIFSFYFCHLEKRWPRLMTCLKFLVFLPFSALVWFIPGARQGRFH